MVQGEEINIVIVKIYIFMGWIILICKTLWWIVNKRIAFYPRNAFEKWSEGESMLGKDVRTGHGETEYI